jgi:hypothetical protein
METIYILITILIIIVLSYELGQCYSEKSHESFSASRTNIIYSNYENESDSQVYAKINEEILLLEQMPGKDRVIKFKYLRAPLKSFVVVYVRKDQDDGQITINTVLIEINSTSTNLIDMFGRNGVFVNDSSKNVRYYVKALNDTTYAFEKDKVDKLKILKVKYNNCINSKNDLTKLNAVAYCKKEFGL